LSIIPLQKLIQQELSDEEKILFWLESHLVENGSFDFRRNDIIKNGPNSSDALSGLYQRWKSLNRREGAVIRRGRYKLCQIYWLKMTLSNWLRKLIYPYTSLDHCTE
jgi:hypothetical protein